MFYSSPLGLAPQWDIYCSKKTGFLGKFERKTVNFENGKLNQVFRESNMTQKSSQDVSSIHEEQLLILVYHLAVCRPVGSAP